MRSFFPLFLSLLFLQIGCSGELQTASSNFEPRPGEPRQDYPLSSQELPPDTDPLKEEEVEVEPIELDGDPTAVLRTKAFDEDPRLQETCEMVVEDPDICVDITVLRGQRVDMLLDTIEEMSGLENIKGTALDFSEDGIESFRNELKNAPPEKQEAAEQALEQFSDLLDDLYSVTRGLFVRSDVEMGSFIVSHEYAHIIFQNHPDQILSQYLPIEGEPIMNEELLASAKEEERRRGLRRNKPLHADYYARPTEEFAFGFQLLAFQNNHPNTTLEDFLPKKKILALALVDYYEALWERVSPLES